MAAARATACTMSQLAQEIYSVAGGWVRINFFLARWLRKKYQRLRAWKRPGPRGTQRLFS